MRKRAVGLIAAAAAGLALMPATASADDVDRTCKNGMEPVSYADVVTDVLVVQVRVLCVREEE